MDKVFLEQPLAEPGSANDGGFNLSFVYQAILTKETTSWNILGMPAFQMKSVELYLDS